MDAPQSILLRLARQRQHDASGSQAVPITAGKIRVETLAHNTKRHLSMTVVERHHNNAFHVWYSRVCGPQQLRTDKKK